MSLSKQIKITFMKTSSKLIITLAIVLVIGVLTEGQDFMNSSFKLLAIFFLTLQLFNLVNYFDDKKEKALEKADKSIRCR